MSDNISYPLSSKGQGLISLPFFTQFNPGFAWHWQCQETGGLERQMTLLLTGGGGALPRLAAAALCSARQLLCFCMLSAELWRFCSLGGGRVGLLGSGCSGA